MSITTNPIMIEFVQKNSMVHHIEGLWEITKYNHYIFTIVNSMNVSKAMCVEWLFRKPNWYTYNTENLFQQEVWRPNKLCCNLNSRPRNRGLGHIIEIHLKVPPNEHVKQEWCKTSGQSLRKWLKTWIMIYFEVQNDPEIGPLRLIWPKTGILIYFGVQKLGLLRPIFSTPLKEIAMSMWSNTDVKPVKTFWENDQRPEFWFILGPKN